MLLKLALDIGKAQTAVPFITFLLEGQMNVDYVKCKASQISPANVIRECQRFLKYCYFLADDRYSFKTDTPKSNIWFLKSRVLAKTDYLTDRTSFGQNAFLFAKIVPLLADTKPMLAARSATDWIFIDQKSLFWPKEAVLAKRNCLGQTPVGPYEAKTCLAD